MLVLLIATDDRGPERLTGVKSKLLPSMRVNLQSKLAEETVCMPERRRIKRAMGVIDMWEMAEQQRGSVHKTRKTGCIGAAKYSNRRKERWKFRSA